MTLSSRSIREFRRWLTDPTTPLKSEAYVLLSNWFLTGGGDKGTDLARLCETFWDELFRVRPPQRLSSPVRGENHKVVPEDFQRFWKKLIGVQDDTDAPHHGPSETGPVSPAPVPVAEESKIALSQANGSGTKAIKVSIDMDGAQVQAEGRPQEVSELLRLITDWRSAK